MSVEVCRIIEKKAGREWVETCRETDPATVYGHLADDLISKKILKSDSIRSITRKYCPNGHGEQRITVDHGNGSRTVYAIPRDCLYAGII